MYAQFIINIHSNETIDQRLMICMSTINDTDDFEKGVSIYFFCYEGKNIDKGVYFNAKL
jgi:hypothetical protein